MTSGNRFETYAILSERGSSVVAVLDAAALPIVECHHHIPLVSALTNIVVLLRDASLVTIVLASTALPEALRIATVPLRPMHISRHHLNRD